MCVFHCSSEESANDGGALALFVAFRAGEVKHCVFKLENHQYMSEVDDYITLQKILKERLTPPQKN